MGLLIRIQSYKEWKEGFITTEELLAGKTFFQVQKEKWSSKPHSQYCCCDKCAPTPEDRQRIFSEWAKTITYNPLSDPNLAPSDCEVD